MGHRIILTLKTLVVFLTLIHIAASTTTTTTATVVSNNNTTLVPVTDPDSIIDIVTNTTESDLITSTEAAVDPHATEKVTSEPHVTETHVPAHNPHNTTTNGSGTHDTATVDHYGHDDEGIVLIPIHYAHVEYPLVFTIIVIFAGLSKLGFHQLHFISSKVPESCLLIIFGLIFGAILHYTGVTKTLTLYEPHEFFLYLLPPIILESAFTLHDREFAENIGGVILFAVWGTVLNCFLIGLSLWGIYLVGAMESFEITFVQMLLFCALIVAVDPVAVLAVFQEVGVNNTLYFLVFGESLLNDGVTVVLYNVMQIFNTMPNITGEQVVLGIVKFLVVCLFGVIIGAVCGLVSSFITKYTNSVKVVEPLIVFAFAYLSYVLCELFEFSGIVAIIVCGLVQAHYAFHNIHNKSRLTVKFCAKVMATTSEIIIFLFLGIVTMDQEHDWKTGFALWSLLFCIIYRFLVTFVMSIGINMTARVRRIGYDEMFMISYGGLRGAVCFSLVALIDEAEVPMKRLFVTTTLFIIFFTVFVQGGSIKWLVSKLKITLASTDDVQISEEIATRVFDNLTAGIEQILGYTAGEHHLKMKLEHFDNVILRPRILKGVSRSDLTELSNCYEKLVMKEHYKNLQLSGAKLKRVKTEIRHLDSELELAKLAEDYRPRRSLQGQDNHAYFDGEKKHNWRDADIDSIASSPNIYGLAAESNHRYSLDGRYMNGDTSSTAALHLPEDTNNHTKGSGLVSFLRNKHMKNKALLDLRRNSALPGDVIPTINLSFSLDGSPVANGGFVNKTSRDENTHTYDEISRPKSSTIPSGYVADLSVDEEDNGRVQFTI